jgi:putative ABC transport system substrate-binding protein
VTSRRDFITLLGGAAAAWPVAARGQQAARKVVGVLGATERPMANIWSPLLAGLRETGFVEGQNLELDYRGSERYEELPKLAAELVRKQVNVIFTATNTNAALAAKSATETIPIVFTTGADPISLGLITTMNRPGKNVTGVTYYANALAPKRLELLRELVPQAKLIAFLVNPANRASESDTEEMLAAARNVGQQMTVVKASNPDQIDEAFRFAAQQGAGALILNPDAFFNSRASQIVVLSALHKIPMSCYLREFTVAGCLMSYGDDRFDSVRHAGVYVGRILKGEHPGELPVRQPTKFELLMNRRTAKAFDLAIPPMLLARADEVIE